LTQVIYQIVAFAPMAKIHINQLPDELLLHIFKAGCDDDSPEGLLWKTPNLRKRKKFASYVCKVCPRWKNLVIGPSFWIVKAVMSTSSGLFPRSFAGPNFGAEQQFNSFRKAIVDSKGSDINVSLYFYSSNILNEEVEEWPAYEIIFLKLLIYALRFLEPVRRQVTGLSIESPIREASPYLLQAFSDLAQLPRLIDLNLKVESPDPFLPSIRHLESWRGKLGFGTLITRRKHHKAPKLLSVGAICLRSLALSRLHHLKDLVVSHLSKLKVATGIKGIQVNNVLAGLVGHPQFANTLRHLEIKIYSEIALDDSEINPARELHKVGKDSFPQSLTLSVLYRLQIEFLNVIPSHDLLKPIMGRLRCPVLTIVDIKGLIPSDPVTDPSAPESQIPPVSVEGLMPSLRTLHVPLTLPLPSVKFPGMAILEVFQSYYSTIDWMVLRYSGFSVLPFELDTGIKDRTRAILSQFRLKKFSLQVVQSGVMSWEAFVLVLDCLSTLRLEELTFAMEFSGLLSGHISDVSEAPKKSMDGLKRLILEGVELQHILGMCYILDAPALEYISIRIKVLLYSNFSTNSELAFTVGSIDRHLPNLQPFPSVRSIKINYRASDHFRELETAFFQLLDTIAPNVSSLEITVYLNSWDTSPNRNGESRLLRYCVNFRPRKDRGLVFPNLSHLHVQGFLGREPEPASVEKARKRTRRTFARRKKAGGRDLALNYFELLFFEERWLVDIWASASDVQC
jgi:hypothetical protein